MNEQPKTVVELGRLLRSGDVTSVEATEQCLARADQLDERLGTYLARFDDSALATAAQADRDFASDIDWGPLQGIPIGLKDLLVDSEGPTTANSLIHDQSWGAGQDGPVVQRLKRAGAVVMGKVTTMEFAVGAPDPSKPFPTPRNPWDLETWAGGSSSGTGNGIAAGLFYAGIGTDTGGSIRIPAAYCGTSGLMPTYGRVPKSGCVPFGFSADHIGPMARSARDCAAMLSVIAGFDASDPTCIDAPVPDYLGALGQGIEGVRIGVEREHHFPGLVDPELSACFERAVDTLVALGADVVEVSLPLYEEGLTALDVITTAESFAYHREDLRTRWSDYGRGARNYFAKGALVSGADYVQAQRVRRLVQRHLIDLFGHVDAVVSPTVATGAPRVALLGHAGGEVERSIFTQYWDLVGNPALAVPMGMSAEGLPLSLQVAGRTFEEAQVLAIGDAYQSRTAWHEAVPPMADVG
jgi:aspartyl-tRNA(Asn)/glutamyl-tRNA(Gln) amidotransferase subunit A